MFGVKRNRKLAVLLSLALVVELFAISPNTASANVSKEPAETVSTGFIEDSQEAPLALRLEDSFWGTTRYDAPSDMQEEPLVLTLEDSFADEAVYDERLDIQDEFLALNLEDSLQEAVTFDSLSSENTNSLMAATPTPYLTINNPSRPAYDHKPQTATYTVNGVKGNLTFSYTWSPSNQKDWVGVVFNGSTITAKISSNSKTTSRSVVIKVTDSKTNKSATITIKQNGAPPTPTPTPTDTPGPTKKPNTPTKKPNTNTPTPYLSLASSTRDYGYQATSDTITVKGRQGSLTFEYSWSPSTQTDWARLIFDGSSIKVTIDENKTTEARSVTVKIIDSKTKKSASIKLNQEAGPSRPDSPTPSSSPGPTSGPKPSNNPTPTNKPGGSPTPTPFLTVSSPTRSYSYTSTTDTITVNGCQGSLQYDFSWTPSTVTGWAHLVYDGKSIKLTLDANPSTTSRSVNVKITDSKTTKTATLTINQAGAPPKPTDPPTPTPFLSISQASRTYTYQGASDTVSVKGVQGSLKYEYTWNSGAKDWVSLLYDGSRIKLTVSPNNSVSSRSVTVKIIDSKTNKTATLTISQSGAPPTPTPFLTINNSAVRTYSHQPTTDTISLSGVQGTLEYEFDWLPSDTPDWAHFVYDGQKIKMTLDPNNTYYFRRVTVWVTDTKTQKSAVFTIEQDGTPRPEPTPTPYLKINNSSTRSFDYHSASDTVTVSGAKSALRFEFSWYPAIEKDWAHIIYDGKTVKFTIDENKATTDRYVVIKIRDSQTLQFAPLTIKQEGAPNEKMGFSVNQPLRSYKCEKTTDTFTLTGAHGALKFEYSWKPSTPTDWARFIYDGQSIKLTLDENKTTSPRTAYVKFIDTTTNKYVNVTIEQEGKPKPVTVEFVVKDKHGEKINTYTRAYLTSGQAYGDVFPQVLSPDKWHIAAWKDENGNYVNRYSIVPSKDMVTLTPVWIDKDKYLIIFDGNGAQSGYMKPQEGTYEKEVILHTVGFDNGSGFDCWGLNPTGAEGKMYASSFNIVRFASFLLKQESNPTYFKNTAKITLTDRTVGSITLYALWYENKRAAYYDPIKASPSYDRLTHIYTVKGADKYPQVELEGLTFLGWSRTSSSFLDTPEFLPGDVTVTDGNNWNLYPVYKLKDKNRYPIYFYDPIHDTITTCDVAKGQTSVTTPDQKSITPPDSSFTEEQYHLYWTTQRTSGLPDAFSYWEAGTDMPLTDEFFDEYSSPVLIAYWDFQQETLTLNYNYDNKKKEVKVTEDNYTLPSPERDGYIFLGWSRDNQDVDYLGGASYHIPINGEELFARWEPIHFTVEYHDGLTGALLEVDNDVTVEDYIKKYPASRVSILGMRFCGWATRLSSDRAMGAYPWLYYTDDSKNPVLEPGCTAGKLPFKEGTVKLYSIYDVKERAKPGEVLLVYLPNGGQTAPTPSRYKVKADLKISSVVMVRDGYDFDGWKVLKDSSYNNKRFPSGGTLDFHGSSQETIFLVAQWTPKHKVSLNVGIEGHDVIDLSKKYGYGDIIKAKDLESNLPSNNGKYLFSWEVSTDSEVKYYSVTDYITIPNKDVTITAVWNKKGYYIHYHSGFNTVLSVPAYVDGALDSSYFDKKNYKWLNVDGFTFIGWTTTNPNGKPWGDSSIQLVKWSDDKPITLTEDLDLYAYYKEDNPLKPGYIRVVYDDNGGTGGPGVQDVNPAKEILLSRVEPTKDGFEFLGWHAWENGSHLPVDDSYIKTYSDDILFLEALWRAQNSNSYLKAELQARYGKTIMPDHYFNDEYQSREWQKINDLCYFVISTKNESKSEHYTDYKSTVLLIQWDYGKWVLIGGSASHNLKKIAEYEVMTHLPDGYGFALKTAGKGALTVLKHVPYAKWCVFALDAISAIGDLIDACKKGDILNLAAIRASSKLADMYFKKFTKLTQDEDEASKMLREIRGNLKNWVFDSLSDHRVEIIKGIDFIGSALLSVAEYDYESKVKEVQETFKVINNKVNLDVWKNAEHDLKQLERYEKLQFSTDIPDWSFDLLEFLWDTAIDTYEYVDSRKALDPFGNRNDALVTFQKEITKHGFSEGIKKEFPDVVQKIFVAYYGLN